MVYHAVNKSIAKFVIFKDPYDFSRMLLAIRYYQIGKQALSLSEFIKTNKSEKDLKNIAPKINCKKDKLVDIIAYCLMPTHLHLMLKELKENGISRYMNIVLNCYTRYFNLKHKRKGPLWERRFKKVLIETDEQLLYVTRYIHLNPVTAYIVDRPEEWPHSSYREYLHEVSNREKICNYSDILTIKPASYKQYVESGISYQRELAKMKKLELE